MATSPKADTIDAIGTASGALADARAGLPDSERFVRHYYRHVAPEDLAGRDADELARTALTHLAFGAVRAPGETKVRVETPDREQRGQAHAHSIVEIVTDDMPFLLDSTVNALAAQGVGIQEVVHPILRVRRDPQGGWLGLARADEDRGGTIGKESFIHIEIDEQRDAARLDDLAARLRAVLDDVRAAVNDWDLMRARLESAAEYVSTQPLPAPETERDEAAAFLNWLADDNFTLLGYREYRVEADGQGTTLALVPASGLGILRDPNRRLLRESESPAPLPPEIADLVLTREPLIVTKSSRRSTVHRNAHMDHIGVKTFGSDGRVTGERRFVGLFTSSAYHKSARQTPLVRRKVRHVLDRAGFAPDSHDGKALVNILESYPRDELFQIDEADLYDTALGILRLETRPQVRLFFRRDPFGRFLSVLAYIPRERYQTTLRLGVAALLEDALGGPATVVATEMGESPLARIHYLVQTSPARMQALDLDALQQTARRAARTWDDDLRDALLAEFDEAEGKRLFRRYEGGFSAGYREALPPRSAVEDVAWLDRLSSEEPLGFRLYRLQGDAQDTARFKLYRLGPSVPLSDCLPILENLGFRVLEERPYSIRRDEAETISLHDFLLAEPGGASVDPGALAQRFAEAFDRVWRGAVENDGFNRLVVRAGLSWREVEVLRAAGKYLRQVQTAFSQTAMEAALAAHADLARLFVELFQARFDPDFDGSEERRKEHAGMLETAIEIRLNSVSSLDEDRVLRRYANLIGAMLRTNFFQTEDGSPKPYLSFKLDSRRIEGLPLPRPDVEIFVYSPRFEGVHLRGGKVARGGIRWSDRREDFRTEILALMKAQQVKNAVIVPVGAKGGFVPKCLAGGGSREAVQEEGVACYRLFMRGLLDLTDNIEGGQVVPPQRVVRHDEDDPYLVVAADKGTATFSDIANGIARDYGFWLDDAFASGGSAGYDHKAMGITARGAWVAVRRHFYELGVDIQSAPFSVVGIGDMSGDVFGNGMLQSRCIRLLAAFDHRHVFIDPDPDPEIGYAERRRLFKLPRSSWADYDAKLISQGGGIFPRNAKSIDLTPEIKALTGLEVDQTTPAELIRALLKAEVDLLWFGGIGTYVKGVHESNAEVGDRANDALRVDGRALRARVVGEGANLACTQMARIEYAEVGGRINMDAVDNSAGVDCSDHEVNIKILLRQPLQDGRLSMEARNDLLGAMTEEVAELVLRDNVLQTLAISLEQRCAVPDLDWHVRLMRELEREGRLNRAVEFLPEDEELARRSTAGLGLTRPEIAVVLSYAKVSLFDALSAGSVPDEDCFLADLEGYFPHPLRERFSGTIAHHRLRREIVATVLANEIVNRGGAAFASRLREESGAGAADVTRGFALVRAAFRLPDLWAGLDALDGRILAGTLLPLYADLRAFLHRQVLWAVRNLRHPITLSEALDAFVPGVTALAESVGAALPAPSAQALSTYRTEIEAAGLPPELADQFARLRPLDAAFDIVQVARAHGRPVEDAAQAYFALGARLGLDRLKAGITRLDAKDHWERLAIQAAVEDLYAEQRALTAKALGASDRPGAQAVEDWFAADQDDIVRAQRAIGEFDTGGALSLPKLTLAGRLLRGLAVPA